MLEPIVSGFTFGLLLAVMLGPVFFALLQTSLHEGFKAGVHLENGSCQIYAARFLAEHFQPCRFAVLAKCDRYGEPERIFQSK